MTIELRVGTRYRLVDRPVVAERTGLGWWLLHSEASMSGSQLTWSVAPDGRIFQGTVEVSQSNNPATCHPLGPITDLTAEDLQLLTDGPYGDDAIDRANRRTLD